MGRSSSRPGTYVSYKLVKNSAQVINSKQKCAGKSLNKEGQKRLTYLKKNGIGHARRRRFPTRDLRRRLTEVKFKENRKLQADQETHHCLEQRRIATKLLKLGCHFQLRGFDLLQ